MSSSKGLDIISRFGAVSSRPLIKEALGKCMHTTFDKYALELEELQAIYEKNKAS